jgi:hypothetical protein
MVAVTVAPVVMRALYRRYSTAESIEASAMKLPRVRLTVRLLMVAVAVVGVSLGLIKRRFEFLQVADHHDSRISVSMDGGITSQGNIHHQNGRGDFIFDEPLIVLIPKGVSEDEMRRRMLTARRRLEANQDWHKAMRRKYQLAASRPWLPVASDPPEPK